jgi:hypothetical protein
MRYAQLRLQIIIKTSGKKERMRDKEVCFYALVIKHSGFFPFFSSLLFLLVLIHAGKEKIFTEGKKQSHIKSQLLHFGTSSTYYLL